MYFYFLLFSTLIVACNGTTHKIDQCFESTSEGTLSLNVAEYVTKSEPGMFGQFFHKGLGTEPEILYDVTISSLSEGTKLDPQSHYFNVQPINDDFLVVCDPKGAVGVSTPSPDGKSINFKGQKMITRDGENGGFVAVYICSVSANKFHAKGKITFKNPHGYIDSGYYGFLTFELFLISGTGLALALWAFLMIKWQDTVMFHHKILSVVLIVTFIDECLKQSILMSTNTYVDGPGFFVLTIESVFHAFRESLIRYIGCMVAKGWGMANEHIDEALRIQIGCALYFIISYMDNSYLFGVQVHTEQTTLEQTVITILCIFDALWATYLVNALRATYSTMVGNKQNAKALFYEMFSYIMLGSMLIGVFLAIFSILFLNTGWRHTNWTQSWWYIDGCWRLEFACILALLMYMFRPQKGSQFYAQATQLPQQEEFGLDGESFAFGVPGMDDLTDNSNEQFLSKNNGAI